MVLTRSNKKAPKSQTPPPLKKLSKAQTPPVKKAEKPQTLTLKKGAKSQKKPPLKKQKKVVVEEDPLEAEEEVSVGSDLESDESDGGEEGSNGFFSDEDGEEELLGDDFLDGSGDDEEEEERSDSDAALSSDSDSDEGDILKESEALDRAKAKEEEDADAELLDFNKEVGPDEEHDTFRLPTEEVRIFGSFWLYAETRLLTAFFWYVQELEEESRGPPDLPLLQSRIKESQ